MEKTKRYRSAFDFLGEYLSIFFGRDLSYLFSGGLFINLMMYAWTGTILILQIQSALTIVSFLFCSYFIGYSLCKIGLSLNVLQRQKPVFEKNYRDRIFFYHAAEEVFTEKYFKRFERSVTLMIMEASIGVALILTAFIMIVIAAIKHWNTNLVLDLRLLFFIPAQIFLGAFSIYQSGKSAKRRKEQKEAMFEIIMENPKFKNLFAKWQVEE